jgi:hypothetical protein
VAHSRSDDPAIVAFDDEVPASDADPAVSVCPPCSPHPPYAPYAPYPPYPPYPPYAPHRPRPTAKRGPGPCVEAPGAEEPCGGGPGGGGEPPQGGTAGWGEPDPNGWQCWNAPFTLPLTRANWPARYFGAPDPSTTAQGEVVQLDVAEAARRLGNLSLSANLTPEMQQDNLSLLRSELDRLVANFPETLLADVPLNAPTGANAPTLGLGLIQQLLLLATDPYFARVLGLYFVDTDADPGVSYDYCIVGDWGDTQPSVGTVFPGSAPAASLSGGAVAGGITTVGGLTVAVGSDNTTLWRWTRDDANGNYRPLIDPAAPAAAAAAMNAAVATISPSSQPEALLAVLHTGPGFPAPVPPTVVTFSLQQTLPQVDVQISGQGEVIGLFQGTAVASQGFSSQGLTTVTLTPPSTGAGLLDQIQIVGAPQFFVEATVFVIGQISLHRLPVGPIGVQYALLHDPSQLTPLSAPDQPLGTFRHRDADVDPATLALTPRSFLEVEWPAPDPGSAANTGDPVSDPANLPLPTIPVGFVVERQDSGVAGSLARLPRRVLAASSPTPAYSKVSSPREFRFSDASAPDPEGGWSYHSAGFDIFGALGSFGSWTAAIGVERIAGAPTIKVRGFDNSPSGGGSATPSPPPDANAWTGGTLTVLVGWSGGVRLMYPDIQTARVTVEPVDINGNVGPTLATQDIVIPPPDVSSLTVSSVTQSQLDAMTWQVDVSTNPPLPLLQDDEASLALILYNKNGGRERFVVRPLAPAPSADPVARVTGGASAALVAAPHDFEGQPAYLVSGFATTVRVQVPLQIPLGEATARAQVSVTGSTQDPFLAGEQIVDPNGGNPRLQPQSATVRFIAAQRLVPPPPSTPVHDVNHVYYDRADFTGRASKFLPFDTTGAPGVDGFILQRCPVQSLMLADMKRRIALGNAADPNPVVINGGGPRPDLQAWIAALSGWLTAYNQAAGTALTMATVLTDSLARQAFIDHFYGGLLDDELRALADIPDNSIGFARVNPTPIETGSTIQDTVDGTGYGRTLYKLASTNSAGNTSGLTGSIGPYYIRVVTSPRSPVLFKVQPTASSVTVSWSLDDNPDAAAYLVYRGTQARDLADLRWFGPERASPLSGRAFPETSGLAPIVIDAKLASSVSFGAGDADPRIIAIAPDPRLCARDYDGSDMAEVPLPPGPAPDEVNAVYRLSDYDASRAALDQPQAFNYWTPPSTGGIAQLVTDSATQSRITGLRIGLGRRVPVVVVATFAGVPQVMGAPPARRATFQDGLSAGGQPLDPNVLGNYSPPGSTSAYAIVAVDSYGNRSLPSKVFVAKLLGS